VVTLVIRLLSKLEERNCSNNEEDQEMTEMTVSRTHAIIGDAESTFAAVTSKPRTR